MSQLDIILTVLFAIGLLQMCWLSVMAVRRHVPSSLIIRALWSLSGIWVLSWPLYKTSASAFIAITMLALATLLSLFLKGPFFSQLRQAWSDTADFPWPMAMFTAALAVAGAFFIVFPEFGFGAGLSLCLGLPLAHWLDRAGVLQLKFPANPNQTLPGHLGLIATVIISCGWSLHVYHQIGWIESLTATALAGSAASMIRALLPHPFNLPAIAAVIGGVLWAL